MRRTAAAALTALVLAACGGGTGTDAPAATAGTAPPASSTAATTTIPTTTTEPTTTTTEPVADPGLPAGWDLHGGLDLGFVLGLPESYVPLDLTGEDIGGLFDEVGVTPQLQEIAQMIENDEAPFAFMAFDFENATVEFVTNINVQVIPKTAFDTADSYVSLLPQQYAALGFGDPTAEIVELGAGRAVLLEATVPVNEDFSSEVIQYVAFGQETLVVLSFSLAEYTPAGRDLALDIFSTVRVLD